MNRRELLLFAFSSIILPFPTQQLNVEQIEILCRPLRYSVMSNDILAEIFQIQELDEKCSIII